MRTFSSLIGRRVQTQSGLNLGRCHDLRGELTRTGLTVTALCVGRGGVLDRLGAGGRTHDEVAWSSIVQIERNRIVVRDP
jgi:sporulation protein YlmC with PRC-barrel domain